MAVYSADKASYLAAFGLIWDFAGAFYLARALVFSKDNALKAQSSTYFNMNVALLKALCEQRVDARIGILLLAVGAALQTLSSIGLYCSVENGIIILAPLIIILHRHHHYMDENVFRSAIKIGLSDPSVFRVWIRYFPGISAVVVEKTIRERLKAMKPAYFLHMLKTATRDEIAKWADQAVGWGMLANDPAYPLRFSREVRQEAEKTGEIVLIESSLRAYEAAVHAQTAPSG